MSQNQFPERPRSLREQLLSGGRAHPLLGWVVIGIGIGAAVGAPGEDMGVSIAIGAGIGLAVGVAIVRRTGGRTLFGKGKDEPPR